MPEDKDKKEIKNELEGMKIMVDLARKRTKMARERNVMSEERTYENYERTLSVWVRTALAAMVFGIAIDRLGTVYHKFIPFTIVGVILVIYSIFVALYSGIRFIKLTDRYKEKDYDFIKNHKTWLPPLYAFMIIVFGVALLILMIWVD